jgi:8-oxo-dGTP diphosphatase
VKTSDDPDQPAGPVVRAAGGVVWRAGAGGLEILVVHRPKYDDWTLPKGKAEPGEDDIATALREVTEETGLDCTLGPELARIHYTDHNGHPKVVRYWAMTADDGPPFAPNREVDEVAWLPLAEAATRLTYERDRPALDALVDAL